MKAGPSIDIQLVHTFLEVHRTRHFARAAEELHVSQAAVSARISQLESILGAPVFVRQRNNIQLTAVGERLLPQAETLLAAWQRLLLQTTGMAAGKEVLAMGCLPSIGEIFLDAWLPNLLHAEPNILLQSELLNSAELLMRLKSGSLDIGLLYETVSDSNLASIKLLEMPLVLVSDKPLQAGDLGSANFVQINWGASHQPSKTRIWELEVTPSIRVDSPRLARSLILGHGGVACLPLQLVAEDLAAAALHRLPFTETDQRELHLVHRSTLTDHSSTVAVIDELQEMIARDGSQPKPSLGSEKRKLKPNSSSTTT